MGDVGGGRKRRGRFANSEQNDNVCLFPAAVNFGWLDEEHSRDALD
jgi:hypothetical protein